MKNLRSHCIFAVTAIAGGITPWLVPSDWFSYVLGTYLVVPFVFASLAVKSAGAQKLYRLGAVWWFVIGTSQSTAKISDPEALALFF
jgi:hypothetical protein